jgi:hypothetical protein
VELPCTAEEYFTLCLADNSKFTEDYCAERKDTDLHVMKKNSLLPSASILSRKLSRAAVSHVSMSLLPMRDKLSVCMKTEVSELSFENCGLWGRWKNGVRQTRITEWLEW